LQQCAQVAQQDLLQLNPAHQAVRVTLAQQAHTQQRLGQCALAVLLEPFLLQAQLRAYLVLRVDMEQALLTNVQASVLQVDMELVLQINAQDHVQLALTQPLDQQPVLLAPLAHMAQQPDFHRALVLVQLPAFLEHMRYLGLHRPTSHFLLFALLAQLVSMAQH